MEIDKIVSKMEANGWAFPHQLIDCLSEYELTFIIGELTGESRSAGNYLQRLKYLGFIDMDNVLDAGCGYGQWSIAMAKLNLNVVGIDIDTSRLVMASHLSEQLGVHNVKFKHSFLETLPFPDSSFDGVFCYSVFMFTQMPTVLREFNRVLKPGGKLYINTDTMGWYAHLLMDVPRDRVAALKMIVKTFLGRTKGIVVRENWLKRQLAKSNFKLVALGNDAEVSFNKGSDTSKPLSFYPKSYYGMRGIIEVAVKKT